MAVLHAFAHHVAVGFVFHVAAHLAQCLKVVHRVVGLLQQALQLLKCGIAGVAMWRAFQQRHPVVKVIDGNEVAVEREQHLGQIAFAGLIVQRNGFKVLHRVVAEVAKQAVGARNIGLKLLAKGLQPIGQVEWVF